MIKRIALVVAFFAATMVALPHSERARAAFTIFQAAGGGTFPTITWIFPTLTTTGTSCGTGNNTCITYVDNTSGQGNDSTCAPQSPPVTNTPAAGTQCATIAHAATLLRTGKPDWLLVKTGDTFTNDTVGTLTVAGISKTQPIIIETYGTGARPIVKTAPAETGACILFGTGSDFIFVGGIEWYSYQRDPSNAAFNIAAATASATGQSNECMSDQQTSFNSIVFENNLVHFYQLGLDIETNGGAEPGAFCLTCFVTMNGNIVVDQYPVNFNPHSQGAFFSGVNLTDSFNLYDNNGHSQAMVGPYAATMTCASPTVVTVTGTPFVFSNGAQISFVGTPCTGINTSTYYCAINVSGNTFNITASNSSGDVNACPNGTTLIAGTGTSSITGVNANDFGSQIFNRNVYTNASAVTFNNTTSSNSSAEGVQFRSGGGPFTDNLFFSDSECWTIGDGITGAVTGTSSRNVCLESVDIAQSGDTPAPAPRGDGSSVQEGETGLIYTGNLFAHVTSLGVNNNGITLDSATSGASVTGNVICWPTSQILDQGTGDTITPNVTSASATCAGLGLPDTTRTVETYDSIVLGGPGTDADFTACERANSMAHWNNNCTAPAANAFIRPGYGLAP
jgi:hypothetical protein